MNRWLRLSYFGMNPPLLCIQIYILQISPKEPWWGEHGTPVKLINLPSLPLFSGADPTPKDEAYYEQWLCQAKGALNSHTEETVWPGTIWSVWGEVRKLMGFIGFQADLTDILDQVKEIFGKAPTANKLQQEFYLLTQERVEKIPIICQSPGTKV